MKIALVSPYDFAYPGGANAHVSLLTREFLKRGHSVKIIAPSSKAVETLGVENFVRLGVPIPIPANGSLARVSFSFWLIPKVKTLLANENFDVIHFHEPMASFLSLVVLKHSRALNIGTFHSFWPKPTNRHKFLKPFLQPYFDRLHGKIVVSEPAGDFIQKVFPSEYAIIPNPIDTSHFSKPSPPVEQFQDGKANILFVGRMEKRKGLSYLLKAYGRIKWDYPDTRLLLVGAQSLDKGSYRIIGERGLQDVVVCGAVPYSELPRYYQAADIFCAPNIGRESFGMVLAEAMAAGVPVVATNNEGFASVVEDEISGILVPPANDEALEAAIRRALEDTELRVNLSVSGRSRARTYAADIVADQILRFYESTWEQVRGCPMSAVNNIPTVV
jgi:phosphatidylinositol alpha-mannosyltransferase